MRVLVDASVLVPALISGHSAHLVAAPWLDRARDGAYELIVSGHNLAETYAVLTRMKTSPPLNPQAVLGLIEENICTIADIVTLTVEDYRVVLGSIAHAGLAGGVIYDALIAQAAIVAGADHILTLNERDFSRLWPGVAERVISPLTTSPPSSDAI